MSYLGYKAERLSVEALNRTRFNAVTNHESRGPAPTMQRF